MFGCHAITGALVQSVHLRWAAYWSLNSVLQFSVDVVHAFCMYGPSVDGCLAPGRQGYFLYYIHIFPSLTAKLSSN